MTKLNDVDRDPVHAVVMRRFEHPWTQEIGWVTEVWETPSHELSEWVAVEAATQGWSIWLVANVGNPSIVVYRECGTEFDGEQFCAGREGMTIGDGTSRP